MLPSRDQALTILSWRIDRLHPSVYDWCRHTVASLGLAERSTLEVGSYDVNGSVRGLFCGDFVGVDIREGPGVDFVVGELLPFDDGEFQVVVSTETLEHVRRPWVTVREAARVLVPGGWFVVTARGWWDRQVYPPHDFPADYWRFSEGGFRCMLEEWFDRVEVERDPTDVGFFAVGWKGDGAGALSAG